MQPVIAIHGGAGVIDKSTQRQIADKYIEGLTQSLAAGREVLQAGGSAFDASIKAVMIMEDNPLFNAGKGAVYTKAEAHELEAAVMNGANLETGAACGLEHVKNPILLAKAVMEKSPYVYMYGKGAEALANKCQLEMVAQSYYDDEIRHAQLLKILETGGLARDHDISIQYPKGTVGAVALDSNGNLAAATSTGGLNGKASGRIGDTSVIGAGTYADNRTCCISCTGFGEQFIRIAAAYDIHARMLYKNLPLTQAAEEVVFGVLPPNTGGLVAVDKYGTVAMPYNTKGMFRGYAKGDGELQAYIWE
jgi:beta-aspartyl-peptidase (threonine type)